MISTKEPSIPFIYPNEDDNEETQYDCRELIERLLAYVLPARNPRLALASICYACGVNLSYILNTDNNSITAIATALGISKECFSKSIKKVSKEFNITHLDTGKDPTTKEIYGQSNRR